MIPDFLHRLRALFRRKAVESELDDEIRFHLDREVEKYMSAGLAREDAVRRANLALGGIEQVKEDCRHSRGISALETAIRDLRYGARVLCRSPAFTAVVVLSLALGIGANTAIFTLIDAVMLKTLPVHDPEHLYLIGRILEGRPMFGLTYHEYRLLRARNRALTDLAAYSPVPLNVSIDGSIEPAVSGQLVTGNYFSLLGVAPVAGRPITIDDDRAPNAHPVAVISHRFWQRRFGSNPATVGRQVSISGFPFTIIGVTPPEFFGTEVGTAPDIFVPVMMQPVVMPVSENLLEKPIIVSTWLLPLGRLKPGVNLSQAAAELTALHRHNSELATARGKGNVPSPFAGETLVLTSAARGLSDLRLQFSQSLRILMAVVAVLLVIACANTANLLLALAAARRSEFALRLSLGAGRWRLIRQLLAESLLLASAGGMLGVLLAQWGTHLLVAFISTGRTPVALDVNPDLRVLAFTSGIVVLTGILFGLAPAWRASRVNLTPALKGLRGDASAQLGALRPGKILAISQVALSVILVSGAAMFARSLQNLDSRDNGFNRQSVLIVRVEPRLSDQRNIPGVSQRLDRIYRELLERMSSVPGVRSASLARFTPTASLNFTTGIKLPSGEQISAAAMMIYPGYFAAMGIPIMSGRDFQAGDLRENSPLVAIVNESFVRRYFEGQDPVGRQFLGRPHRGDSSTGAFIGVVRDSPYANLRGDPPPMIYQPFFQLPTGRGQMVLHVRITADPGGVIPRIREEIQKVDNTLPVFNVYTLAEEVDAALMRERLIAVLSSLFSALALLLACVGLYGLTAFNVVRRTGEMGIRMALGANGRDVQWMVLREALLVVLAGVAIGIPSALAVGRLASSQISGLLFGLSPHDPAAILTAGVVMILVVGIAGYLPARRASRLDPMAALRIE
jgi:predicted permease